MKLETEKTLAWARYLFWADLSRRHFDTYVEGPRIEDEWQDWWHFFALMSQWYAAEYVVIEGWREADLHDPVIDEVLARSSDVTDMLRRYRNGVFHYQPALVEKRFMPILEDAERSMPWVYFMHTEYLRFYWSYVNDFSGTAEQRSHFRDSMLHIVGWIPEDTFEAECADLLRLADETDALTTGNNSPAANNLRESCQHARITALKQLSLFREHSRSFLLGVELEEKKESDP
jgi:hypothetical protein